jgi:hypothetical protein
VAGSPSITPSRRRYRPNARTADSFVYFIAHNAPWWSISIVQDSTSRSIPAVATADISRKFERQQGRGAIGKKRWYRVALS